MRISSIFIVIVAAASAVVLVPSKLVQRNARTLTMATWGMPFEDSLFRDGYARGFEKLNPGWRVEYQRHNNITDKYNAWHVQNRGTDVMRMGIDYYHEFVAKGMIIPLNEFIDDPTIGLTEEEVADYFPSILERLVIDGEIYALPSDNAQYGVYYHRALFDRYNAEHPESRIAYPSEDWTWADLGAASRALTITDAESDRTTQFGLLFDLWAWPFLAFLHQAGGTEWDEAQTTTLINSDAGVEALTFLVSLVPDDAPIKAQNLAASAANPAELFKTGRVAMLLDGSWRSPNVDLDAPNLNYAIAPLPHNRKRAVVSGSVLWAVSAHSLHPRRAFEMIKWMTNREESTLYWQTLRVAPPARLSAVESEGFKSTTGLVDTYGIVRIPPMPRSRYDDLAKWLEYAVRPNPESGGVPGFVPAGLYQSDLQAKISSALVAATRGELTPREALDQAAREMQEIIDRDRAAKGLPPVER